MKIVLVLALVLGVALFPENGTADDPKCYECGGGGGGGGGNPYPWGPPPPPSPQSCDKLTAKLTDDEKEKFEKKCDSEYCLTEVGYDGKVIKRGCYMEYTGLSKEESLLNNTLKGMQRVAECLKSKGVKSCYSDWNPECSKAKETTRKRRQTDGDTSDTTDAAPAPPAAGADDKQGEKSTGKDADGTKNAPSGAESNADGRAYEDFVPNTLKCLCKGSKCNFDTKGNFHKCYECSGTSVEGKEDPCTNLDTEKAKQIDCPGEHCGIYKYKLPGATPDEKGVSEIRRGCAPVGSFSQKCFDDHGEELDKATCAIGNPKSSLSTYAKVRHCLSSGGAASRTSLEALEVGKITPAQQAGAENIFCICKGELCNDSGKGSHLVLSNGVVMLGLMMMIARTGKLI